MVTAWKEIGSEEEASRRAEERTQQRQEEERRQEDIDAKLAQVEDIDAQIDELVDQPNDEGYDASDRLDLLEHAEGELLAALGDPEAPEQAEEPNGSTPSQPDCGSDTLCGEAEAREQQLEDDRAALEEYAQEAQAGERTLCSQAINYSYWQPADEVVSNVVSGNEISGGYAPTRSQIQDARENLPGVYEEALSLAREREEIVSSLPESLPDDQYPGDLNIGAFEATYEDAQAAAEDAGTALEEAEAKKEEYAQRIAQVTEEAAALYEAAECAD